MTVTLKLSLIASTAINNASTLSRMALSKTTQNASLSIMTLDTVMLSGVYAECHVC
jgi:hypothetical protein